MRGIIFRGKRLDNNEWAEGYFIEQNTPEYHAYIVKLFEGEVTDKYIDIFSLDIVEVIPKTVGQYTGLTDKNDKKIFERDIVKQTFETTIEEKGEDDTYIYGYDIGEAILIPSKGACIKNPYQHREVNCEVTKGYEKTKMCKNLISYRCEILGNIYDNPLLLEAEE